MGGSGSGGWQGRRRGTVEAHRQLRVHYLHRGGALVPGTVSELGDGEHFAMEIRAEQHRVVFRYSANFRGSGQWATVNEPVRVSWTPCNYGGARPWLHCPVCDRRVGILYLVESLSRFRCRHCANLSYATQRMASVNRNHRRTDKLRGRVIEGDDGLWYKPPRMHWRTFDRICNEMEVLDRALAADTYLWIRRHLL